MSLLLRLLNSGAASVTGEAALSGAGSLASAGVRTRSADAALVGSGSLTAAGLRTALGKVDEDGNRIDVTLDPS